MAFPSGPPSPTALQFSGLALRGLQSQPDRITRWVNTSYKTFANADDPHTGFQLQQCAFLELPILAFEGEKRTDPGPDCGDAYVIGQGYEFLLGDCWLLFAYEILRTFRDTEKFKQFAPELRGALNQIYRFFALVRMPLAKHEAATMNDTFHVPIRIINEELGTAGWRVYDKVAGTMVDVLRRPLADALLAWAEGSQADIAAISAAGSREMIKIIKA